MFFDLIATFAVAGAVVLFIWLLRGLLLMPVKKGVHTKLTVVLSVDGAEPCLEQTVRGLCWLRSNGALPGNVVISDAGMDEETLNVAKRLVLSQSGVCCRREDVTVCQRNEASRNYMEESTP